MPNNQTETDFGDFGTETLFIYLARYYMFATLHYTYKPSSLTYYIQMSNTSNGTYAGSVLASDLIVDE